MRARGPFEGAAMEPSVKEAAAEDVLAKKVDVLCLFRLRDQMKQQLMEYNTAARANTENCPNNINRGDLKRDKENLGKDIEEVKASFQNKTLALQRIQVTAALRQKVMQKDDDSRPITETVKQIALLSNAITEHEQQAHEKEQKLLDIKRRRFSLQKSGEQVLQEIQTVKKKVAKRKGREMSGPLEKVHKLKEEKDIIVLIQNIFQNVVIGSRVNWAEDPSLKNTLLQLEKNINFL
ncbi:centromere protein H [Pogoniulus pusillus]|uniref:centromere protein H n=1 Tax=Pogoniulus pusillus TaxID=488313 RepID=UPI0030B98468